MNKFSISYLFHICFHLLDTFMTQQTNTFLLLFSQSFICLLWKGGRYPHSNNKWSCINERIENRESNVGYRCYSWLQCPHLNILVFLCKTTTANKQILCVTFIAWQALRNTCHHLSFAQYNNIDMLTYLTQKIPSSSYTELYCSIVYLMFHVDSVNILWQRNSDLSLMKFYWTVWIDSCQFCTFKNMGFHG